MAGRPAYKPTEKHLQKAFDGARDGLTDAEIAKSLNIAYMTLYRHKGEFSEALKKGREEMRDNSVIEIESAGIKEAKGYWVDEKHVERVTDASGKLISIKQKVVKKWMRPQPMLNVFYMVNNSNDYESVNNIKTQDETPEGIDNKLDRIAEELAKRDLDD